MNLKDYRNFQLTKLLPTFHGDIHGFLDIVRPLVGVPLDDTR